MISHALSVTKASMLLNIVPSFMRPYCEINLVITNSLVSLFLCSEISKMERKSVLRGWHQLSTNVDDLRKNWVRITRSQFEPTPMPILTVGGFFAMAYGLCDGYWSRTGTSRRAHSHCQFCFNSYNCPGRSLELFGKIFNGRHLLMRYTISPLIPTMRTHYEKKSRLSSNKKDGQNRQLWKCEN